MVGAQIKTDRILIAAEMAANSLDSHTVGANRPSYGLQMMIYDRLLKFGTKTLASGAQSYDYFKLEPQLAESWEIAPDQGSVTFKLRRDDTRSYQKGIKVSAVAMKGLYITGDQFHPEWNYTIRPGRHRNRSTYCSQCP